MLKKSILLPSRNRVGKLKKTLDNLNKKTKNKIYLEIVLGVDKDDKRTQKFIINYKSKIKIITCLQKKKLGYSGHAIRFYNMLKKSSHDLIITYADDVLFKTKEWDVILEKELIKFNEDKIFLAYPSHNQKNSNWPLIQIINKKWFTITKKISNTFEIDTELMIISFFLKRIHFLKNIKIFHDYKNNDKTFSEGRGKVLNNQKFYRNSILSIKNLYYIFQDLEKLNLYIKKKKITHFVIILKILLLFIPRLIKIYLFFKINYFKIFLKNLILFRSI